MKTPTRHVGALVGTQQLRVRRNTNPTSLYNAYERKGCSGCLPKEKNEGRSCIRQSERGPRLFPLNYEERWGILLIGDRSLSEDSAVQGAMGDAQIVLVNNILCCVEMLEKTMTVTFWLPAARISVFVASIMPSRVVTSGGRSSGVTPRISAIRW